MELNQLMKSKPLRVFAVTKFDVEVIKSPLILFAYTVYLSNSAIPFIFACNLLLDMPHSCQLYYLAMLCMNYEIVYTRTTLNNYQYIKIRVYMWTSLVNYMYWREIKKGHWVWLEYLENNWVMPNTYKRATIWAKRIYN